MSPPPRRSDARPVIRLRLYVSGNSPTSLRARQNLAAMCDRYWMGRNEVEIVDVEQYPERALLDHVFLTPMLIKLGPAPQSRVAGDLDDWERVLIGLWLEGEAR